MFSLICAWTNGWVHNRDAIELIMTSLYCLASCWTTLVTVMVWWWWWSVGTTGLRVTWMIHWDSTPADKRRNNNVIMASKRRFDVIMTSLWRHYDVIMTSLLRLAGANGVSAGSSLARDYMSTKKQCWLLTNDVPWHSPGGNFCRKCWFHQPLKVIWNYAPCSHISLGQIV